MSKLQQLAELEGFDSTEELISEAMFGMHCYGICTNPECDWTQEVEPDTRDGLCPQCGMAKIKSCEELMLEGQF